MWAQGPRPRGSTDPARRTSLQILPEPVDSPREHVLLVLPLVEAMPLARIDHEARLDAFGFQRMPELIRLGRRTLLIRIADNDQSRSIHVPDVCDRRTARVDGRIVVPRAPEIRDHPLVDEVLSVVA